MLSLAAAWTQEVCPREEAVDALKNSGGLASVLSQNEIKICLDFKVEKRRLDWLSGRLAAKKALSPLLALPPNEIEILNKDNGRPYCAQPGSPEISITHTALGGLCAVSSGAGPIGADWEMIGSRHPRLLEFYAHAAERSTQATAGPEALTRLWAAKEAVLKFLGAGPGCDPRHIRLRPSLRLEGTALRRWQENGRLPLALWEKTLADSVIAVAYSDLGGIHGKSQE